MVDHLLTYDNSIDISGFYHNDTIFKILNFFILDVELLTFLFGPSNELSNLVFISYDQIFIYPEIFLQVFAI